MRFLASIFLCSLLAVTASPQSQKPKPTNEKSKPANTKTKSAAQKTKPETAKSKPAATLLKKPSEQAEWDKAIAITDPAKRIAALRKFLEVFPRSTRKPKAFESISVTEAELGNEKLAAGDTQAGADLFKAAANDAPKPIPEKLFTETLSKFPANLYFRGLRDEALEITKTLENKAGTNAGQLLSIAGFYISIENGSEAKRSAENAIKIEPNSSAAYQTLGLANRVDFRLEESAAAYAKALELEPDSLSARRGLAEMKRSLGKPDEAVALYREILDKEDANLPARTGLILALFDAEKRAEAEAEMTKSLEANPGNVILLASAAYWYAAHNEGSQAVALAQKAIETDPRFIWSHIALARGFLNQNKPLDAERTLLAARRYGNFPTLEYEIASARLAAGLYREAVEELSKSFSVKDGVIHADLGGRVPLESKNFSELVGFERRASIFAPMAADDPVNAEKLKTLLEFKQELAASEPKSENAANAADNFIQGDDKMKVHRQIFVASELLEKKIALPKVLEIVKAAPSNLDAGLEIPDPATAIMASELYENRMLAAARGQYVNVPPVPKQTLSSVLRGRIEEISGWAFYQLDDAAQAAVHLKRAVGVLPVDSAWWRSSMWRLGTALVVSGKDDEALEAYIKSYKSSGPNSVRYKAIEAVYKRVSGNTLGLEERIGPDPSPLPPAETVAHKTEPTPEIKTETPTDATIKTEATSTSSASPELSPDPVKIESPLAVETKTEPTPDEGVKEIPKPDVTPETELKPTPESTPELQKTAEETPKDRSVNESPTATPKELFPSVIITIPAPETKKTLAKESEAKTEPIQSPTPEIKPCTLIIRDETITFQNGNNDLAVIVRREDDGNLDGLTAVSSSSENITIKREKIEGLKAQAIFVVHSLGLKTGEYQIFFEMPCGKKEVSVKVQ